MSEAQEQYDLIFLGSGCASLSILCRMIDTGKFSEKKILLLDKSPKNKNDRTWCFWEKKEGYFESLVHCQWQQLFFETEKSIIDLDIKPYQYKMIRGIDFYNYCFSKIHQAGNITLQYGNIEIKKSLKEQKVFLDGKHLDTSKAIVFNSIYDSNKNENSFYLLQHFKGWVIETADEHFEKATLMDFSISQKYGTAFIYLLPLSKKKALIEFTLFTENILDDESYNEVLKEYIEQKKGIKFYTISESEFGIIPMTNMHFDIYNNGLYNIGTAGGQTKGSTGYTFNFIQKQSDRIVSYLIKAGVPPIKEMKKNRFSFYDSTFLHILSGKKLEGKEVFSRLFEKNSAKNIFKFLDNETSILEDLKIINSLPKKEFLKAGMLELKKMFKNNKD